MATAPSTFPFPVFPSATTYPPPPYSFPALIPTTVPMYATTTHLPPHPYGFGAPPYAPYHHSVAAYAPPPGFFPTPAPSTPSPPNTAASGWTPPSDQPCAASSTSQRLDPVQFSLSQTITAKDTILHDPATPSDLGSLPMPTAPGVSTFVPPPPPSSPKFPAPVQPLSAVPAATTPVRRPDRVPCTHIHRGRSSTPSWLIDSFRTPPIREGTLHQHRLAMETYANEDPSTTENSRALYTGEKSAGNSGSVLHPATPYLTCQGRDLTKGNNTSNSETLSMVNASTNHRFVMEDDAAVQAVAEERVPAKDATLHRLQQQQREQIFNDIQGQLAKLTAMASQLAISLSKHSTSPHTSTPAASAAAPASAVSQVFGEMPTPNFLQETHGTDPRNCSRHHIPIQSTCVSNFSEQNFGEMAQEYDVHNLNCKSVVPEPMFAVYDESDSSSTEYVCVFPSKPEQQPYEEKHQEGDRLLKCSSKALETDHTGACLNIISDVRKFALERQQQDDEKACNCPLLKASDSYVTRSNKLSSAHVVRGLRLLWDLGDHTVSTSTVGNVGVTAPPSVAAHEACLAPVFCSKTNNTADSALMLVPNLHPLMTVQDVSSVFKEMSVYDQFDEGNQNWLNEFISLPENTIEKQKNEDERTICGLEKLIGGENLSFAKQDDQQLLKCSSKVSAFQNVPDVYARRTGQEEPQGDRKLFWKKSVCQSATEHSISFFPWDPGDTKFHDLSMTATGAARLPCTNIYKFELVHILSVQFGAKREPKFESAIMCSYAFDLGWTEVNIAAKFVLVVPCFKGRSVAKHFMFLSDGTSMTIHYFPNMLLHLICAATTVQVTEQRHALEFSLMVVILPNESESRDGQLAYISQAKYLCSLYSNSLVHRSMTPFKQLIYIEQLLDLNHFWAQLLQCHSWCHTPSVFLQVPYCCLPIVLDCPYSKPTIELFCYPSMFTSVEAIHSAISMSTTTPVHMILLLSSGKIAQEGKDAAAVYKVLILHLPMRQISHVWDPGIESILVFYKWLHIQIIHLVHYSAQLPPTQITTYCPSNIEFLHEQGVKTNYKAKNLLSSPNYLQIKEMEIIYITFLPP